MYLAIEIFARDIRSCLWGFFPYLLVNILDIIYTSSSHSKLAESNTSVWVKDFDIEYDALIDLEHIKNIQIVIFQIEIIKVKHDAVPTQGVKLERFTNMRKIEI